MDPAAPVDHWEVLGLEPGADPARLKQAFRRQARRWHPDLNSNDPVAEERFKRINEAYEVLSDPRRREAWESGVGEGLAHDPFSGGFPDFHDYLDHLFGRRQNSREDEARERRPVASTPPPPPVMAHDDLETTVELSPDQALEGTLVEVDLGEGLAVEVQTPAEAGDGWRLRLEGVARGGRDHFLHLQVRTDDGLRIDGLRVLYRLDLPAPDGALGGAAVVPTLDGPVRLRIPPGTSSGRLLRLRGKGLEHDGRRGDQIVEVRLVVPEELQEAESSLYSRLRDLLRD
jgi:curved DNA-binding protein|tara:strand:+ start:4261 stop:5121 length:861 start_codon:yes stop_codon:yes gene_type:complete